MPGITVTLISLIPDIPVRRLLVLVILQQSGLWDAQYFTMKCHSDLVSHGDIPQKPYSARLQPKQLQQKTCSPSIEATPDEAIPDKNGTTA